jgi:hypothetical protein
VRSLSEQIEALEQLASISSMLKEGLIKARLAFMNRD